MTNDDARATYLAELNLNDIVRSDFELECELGRIEQAVEMLIDLPNGQILTDVMRARYHTIQQLLNMRAIASVGIN